MAVKDFRDLVGDLVSDFAKNSSQDVYVFTQTGHDKYHLHDGKCNDLQKDLKQCAYSSIETCRIHGL